MKILTIGASPYLLVRNGKIHSDVIRRLVSEGHEVASAVWHHDEGYFMPSEENVHSYEFDCNHVCYLYPFMPKTEESSPFIYELMKAVQPDIVITIGDHKDTNFVYAIKAMYPTLFKWIAVYTIDCKGIPVVNKDAFEYADCVITTNEFALKEISSFANVQGLYVPYGPNHEIFSNLNGERDLVLCSARNAQSSNIPSFIMATSEVKSYLHTNMYDPGDYNIDGLKEKYKSSSFEYTTDFCSIKDGVPDSKMVEIYNKSSIIVDCSIKSATALSLLEAMACGCVPIGPNYGRVGEIISEMPEGFQFTVQYNVFIGQNEEEFAIVSPVHLNSVINQVLSNKDVLQEASMAAVKIAKKYSNVDFLNKLVDAVKDVYFSRQVFALDSI